MRIIISGILGRMGTVVREAAAETQDIEVSAGFDFKDCETDGIPVYSAVNMDEAKGDVVVDFSNFSFTQTLISWCRKTGTPVVVATTALGEKELVLLEDAAKEIAVFRSANMSLGINLIAKMARMAMPAIESDFDVEIIEKHHNRKVDSPSGTALLLADAVSEACRKPKEYIYGRHSKHDEPMRSQIGIHAVRGGTLPGEHTIIFAGPDEVIELNHNVYSRKVFATGALAAARFIVGKPAGLYSMDELLAG